MEWNVDTANKTTLVVLGSRGLVGSSCVSYFSALPHFDVISVTRKDVDLTKFDAVSSFMEALRPNIVILAAGTVGGILVNNQKPVEFFRNNMLIQLNVLEAAYQNKVDQLIFLGSSCIYPRESDLPIGEEALLTGRLEPTNEPYALAKISGLKLCQYYNKQYETDFRGLMPTNLYGTNDNFSAESGHVIPGLMRRIHDAKVHKLGEVEVWGSGAPIREFLHSDDLAEAISLTCAMSKQNYHRIAGPSGFLNVGSGSEISISELARLIARIVGYDGRIFFNEKMPDGVFRKTLDSSKLHKLGWSPKIELENGLQRVYENFARWRPDSRVE